ncbi:hypothetical protein SAMN05421807_102332 [Virgibacillus chiguensis]|uniref:Uncharacterized protein n=1 Tax=Virgibacillus chiguensis TaxID=411959 RepID=A0A1M5NUG9_9BACI|nr:hypothetical protein SAMN05421807_102332 [Virgibacillus chiguensis]
MIDLQFETRSLIFDNLLIYETRQLRKKLATRFFHYGRFYTC